MTIETYVQAMPKADLHVHLEGIVPTATFLAIAEQNEIPFSEKDYGNWAEMLVSPDVARLDALVRRVTDWVVHLDDVSRLVYDAGVQLSKQNVRYAEITIDPTLYLKRGWSFEQLLTALNDGRDRAERGWNIRISWILAVARSEPRSGDEIARSATNVASRKGGIVGLGLTGHDDVQPLGQFSRAFRTAEKKELSRMAHIGGGVDEIQEALDELAPNRMVIGAGLHESEAAIEALIAQDVAVDVGLAHLRAHAHINAFGDYPLQSLYDRGLHLTLGSDMAGLLNVDLNTIYAGALQECGLEIDELEDIALNSVRYSFISDDDKAALLAEFTEAYQSLRAEHLVAEE